MHELASDPVRRASVKCLVQGPFDSPAKDALKSPTSSVLLLASGIGKNPEIQYNPEISIINFIACQRVIWLQNSKINTPTDILH